MAKRYKEDIDDDSNKRPRVKRKKDLNKLDEEIVEKKNKKKKEKKHPRIRKIIRILIIIITVILLIRFIISVHRWKMLAKDMLINENSVVLDTDGNIIATIGEEKIKTTVSSDKIPQYLKDAYVAIEDERFYSHGGVDVKRTGGAVLTYISHFGSSPFGGSTITQQLVKNMTGDSSSKPTRKVKEWWRAIALESCTSKDQILVAYLNTIYVGPNIYGVEEGSKYYFNKSVENLDLAECAFMAGINNSPNSYNPFVENSNLDSINKRARTVLNKMKELGKISNEDYENAISEIESGLKFEKGESKEKGDGVFSYHTDALINEVCSDLAKKYNISDRFALNYLENAGATIYSTQDSNIQKEVETEFEKQKYMLSSKNSTQTSQAAMIVLDHKTGYVVGCAGGLGKKETARPLNRAVQSVRQTGSAMKPVAILAPALDKKIVTPATIVDDTPRDFQGGYHPEDYNSPLRKGYFEESS